MMLTNDELRALFAGPGAPSQEMLLSTLPVASPFPVARLFAFIQDPLTQGYFKKLDRKIRECRAPVPSSLPVSKTKPKYKRESEPKTNLASSSVAGPSSAVADADDSDGTPSPSSPTPKSPNRLLSPKKSFLNLMSPPKKAAKQTFVVDRPKRPTGAGLTSHPVSPFEIIRIILGRLGAEGVVAQAVKGLMEEKCELKEKVGLDSDKPGKTHWECDYIVWFIIMIVENQMHIGIFAKLAEKMSKEEKAEEKEAALEGAAWFIWGVLKFMCELGEAKVWDRPTC